MTTSPSWCGRHRHAATVAALDADQVASLYLKPVATAARRTGRETLELTACPAGRSCRSRGEPTGTDSPVTDRCERLALQAGRTEQARGGELHRCDPRRRVVEQDDGEVVRVGRPARAGVCVVGGVGHVAAVDERRGAGELRIERHSYLQSATPTRVVTHSSCPMGDSTLGNRCPARVVTAGMF